MGSDEKLKRKLLRQIWTEEASKRYKQHEEQRQVTLKSPSLPNIFCDTEITMKTSTQEDYSKILTTFPSEQYRNEYSNHVYDQQLITFWSSHRRCFPAAAPPTDTGNFAPTLKKLSVPGATSETFKRNSEFSTPIEIALDPPEWAGWKK